MPMPAFVNGLPVGPTTRAPASRQRAASGMSAVTAMSLLVMRVAIQSSAASGPSDTTTRLISGPSGRRMNAFDTKWMTSPCRSATRTASSFTGQASAST